MEGTLYLDLFDVIFNQMDRQSDWKKPVSLSLYHTNVNHIYAHICMSCCFLDPQLNGKHLVVLFWQSFAQYTCPTATWVLSPTAGLR